MVERPSPPEGIVLTHFIVSNRVERSRRFYTEVSAAGWPSPETRSMFTSQLLDRHQCRRRPDRRQPFGHPGDAA